MGYHREYRIRPSLLGYLIERLQPTVDDIDKWVELSPKAFETRAKAEEGLRRWRSEPITYYDENGEEV